MSRGSAEQPHPIAAAFEVALGSDLAIWPWWIGTPGAIEEWLAFGVAVLAGVAALGFAVLNGIAMWEAPPGQLSSRRLLVACVLAVAWVVGPGENGDPGSTVGRNALVVAYAGFVVWIALRESRRSRTETQPSPSRLR